LDANGARIIQVGRVQRPTLDVFAKYAPEYPCLATALTNWIPQIDNAWRGNTFHLTIVTAPQRPGYQPGEEPRWADSSGPNCYGMPGSYFNRQHFAPGVHFNDGTSGSSSSARSALPSMFTGTSGVGIPSADSGLAGTEQEQQLVAALLSTDGTAQPSAITTLLAGPILRGTVVSQQ
jgi:hypothetical protein